MEVTDQIKLVGCSKHIGKKMLLDHISLTIQREIFVSIIGPSGSGKTTLARLIAGLEKPDQGNIFINGELVSSDGKILKHPSGRKIGFIFQDLTLWPHFTVYQNVSFGLEANGVSNLKDEVFAVLKQFDIDKLQNRYPSQLSGGQQQLVALARSIIMRPSILIMDEPMANLDVKYKRQIRKIIKQLQTQGLTIIYITHDHREAFDLSDKIVLLNEGRIEESGSPQAIRLSANSFTKEFLEID